MQKKKIQQEKKRKIWLRQKCCDIISECHDIISECHDIILECLNKSSRQPAGQCSKAGRLCHDRDKARLKVEI